jgi:hypothetical protein
VTALDFLKWMRDERAVPWSRENKPPEGRRPSNSELVRWIRNGSVRVDGMTLSTDVEVEFPINVVEFFRNKALVTTGGFTEVVE